MLGGLYSGRQPGARRVDRFSGYRFDTQPPPRLPPRAPTASTHELSGDHAAGFTTLWARGRDWAVVMAAGRRPGARPGHVKTLPRRRDSI